MIRIENLKLHLGRRYVISNATLRFDPGTFYLMKGSSGSGKTTLIYILGLISSQKDYQYYFNGQRLESQKEKEMIKKQYIGVLYQNFNLNGDVSLYHHLQLFASLNHHSMNEMYARELLEKVDLQVPLDRKFSTLSDGEKQRFCLACILAKKPAVIIADEPTSALDDDNAERLMGILHRLAKEERKLVIVSTHTSTFDHLADAWVRIENDVISQTKNDIVKKEVKREELTKLKSNLSLFWLLLTQQLRRLFKVSKIPILLSIIMLSFSVFLIRYGNTSINDYQETLDHLLSKEMFLNKVEGFEPFDEESLDFIQALDGVKQVHEVKMTLGNLYIENTVIPVEVYLTLEEKCFVDSSLYEYVDKELVLETNGEKLNIYIENMYTVEQANFFSISPASKVFIPVGYFTDKTMIATGDYILELDSFLNYDYVEDKIATVTESYTIQSPYRHYQLLLYNARVNEIYIEIAFVAINIVVFILLVLVQYQELRLKKQVLCLYEANGLTKKDIFTVEMIEIVVKVIVMMFICICLCILYNYIANTFLLHYMQLNYTKTYTNNIATIVLIDVIIPHLLFSLMIISQEIESQLRSNQ